MTVSTTYEDELRRALGPGRSARVLGTTGSTNEVALDWAVEPRDPAPHGAVVVADEQTAGRGRWGRGWESSPGKALMFSVVLRPQGLSPNRLGLLTAAMGVAVIDAVASLSPLAPTLKWPNDVNVRGRKLAGVLFETQLIVDRVGVVVAGVGVNTHWTLDEIPEEIRERATSLGIETESPPLRGELLAAILEAFDVRYLGILDGSGIAALLERADELSELKGELVDVVWHDRRVVQGRAGSLTATGALEVEIDGRMTEVDVAEVTRIRSTDS